MPVVHNRYDLSQVNLFTYDVVMAVTEDEIAAIQWCMDVGLIRQEFFCPQCSNSMKQDGTRWRCRRSTCNDLQFSVRKGTVFVEVKIPIRKFVRILFHYASNTPVTKCASQKKVSQNTVSKVYSICRDMCSEELCRTDMKIGGYGAIVEIDETSLKKKSKYNRGRHYPDCWLFGGVDRGTKQWFGRIVYGDRTKKTLSELIREHINPGTLIISDKFSSYVSLNGRHNLANNPVLRDMDYSHQWVDHSENFVNPTNGAHTQTIEGYWEIKVKRHMKAMRGVIKEMIPELIDEYLWRSWCFRPKVEDAMFMAGIC
ncbi:hypothetical protein Ae201684_012713 [Aphanomyces euteiches]|uniref:ISXO2-like transposase domain-containing protein n=1 Tax=Aphanomyces euteiches TaxID=100861 RepID=A0A6G0WQH5_9STRA|nr:hypothetical protein Ae201684_012713 [Aphanomyces euteiches]